MGDLGIEPRTYRLKAEYSTIELVTRIFKDHYNCYSLEIAKKKKSVLKDEKEGFSTL